MTTKRSRGSSADEVLSQAAGGPITFGRALAAIRRVMDQSQVDFAKMLGITKAHLCDIEKGRRLVSPERAAEFARKMKHPIATWVKLAVQDQLDQAGLKLIVEVRAA